MIGATAPWRPGVAEGHNDRIGWTMAPLGVDTQDVYVERLNPANARQVEDDGRWVDIDARKDWIAVRGRKTPVDFTTETTRHGVMVASDLERHLAFAIRWSGSEPGAAAELAATALDRAASDPEFHGALTHWKMPARKIAYVDTRGTASLTVSFVPGRRGWNGAMPVPGWTRTTEWKGWIAASPPPLATSTKGEATQILLDSLRGHPDRADALLQALATRASTPDSLTAQRAAMVDALAEALRERAGPAGGAVLFAHPFGVTEAARRRFNVLAQPPAGPAADLFAMTFDPADWDRSTAINAPGQSESPESEHFADLAKLWSDGKSFPLAFTETAVQAHASRTLLLTPR